MGARKSNRLMNAAEACAILGHETGVHSGAVFEPTLKVVFLYDNSFANRPMQRERIALETVASLSEDGVDMLAEASFAEDGADFTRVFVFNALEEQCDLVTKRYQAAVEAVFNG